MAAIPLLARDRRDRDLAADGARLPRRAARCTGRDRAGGALPRRRRARRRPHGAGVAVARRHPAGRAARRGAARWRSRRRRSARPPRCGSTPRASSSRPRSSSSFVPRPHRVAEETRRVASSPSSRRGCASSGASPLVRAVVAHGAADQPHRGAVAGRPRRCSRARSTGARPTSASSSASSAAPRSQARSATAPSGTDCRAGKTFLVCFSVVPIGYLALATQPSLPVALAALALVRVRRRADQPAPLHGPDGDRARRSSGAASSAPCERLHGRRYRSASCSAASLVAAIGAPRRSS